MLSRDSKQERHWQSRAKPNEPNLGSICGSTSRVEFLYALPALQTPARLSLMLYGRPSLPFSRANTSYYVPSLVLQVLDFGDQSAPVHTMTAPGDHEKERKVSSSDSLGGNTEIENASVNPKASGTVPENVDPGQLRANINAKIANPLAGFSHAELA